MDLPFGAPWDGDYRVQDLDLAPGDRLVLITDGMTERNTTALDLPARIEVDAALHPAKPSAPSCAPSAKPPKETCWTTPPSSAWTGMAPAPASTPALPVPTPPQTATDARQNLAGEGGRATPDWPSRARGSSSGQPSTMPNYVPSPAEVAAAQTPDGGWTRKQLTDWGVPWPPLRAGADTLRRSGEAKMCPP
ncbi:SpoIIE family protein phosphatase [Streptomyces sp. NPDC005507]|uniref:SpoIIE family protein phosphatase n=1 Tax=Streptomyces sp. NPDC005507 TaxID=3154885 RepID=UPI0033A2986D